MENGGNFHEHVELVWFSSLFLGWVGPGTGA